MKPTTTLATFATVAALALAGCSAGTSSQNGGMDGGTSAGSAAYDSSKSQQSTVDTATTPTSVIRTGDMSLNTQDVSGTYDKVKAAVIAAGGRIESSTYYAGGDGQSPSGQVIARIPETKLDAAIAAISELGQRTALNLNSTDVTLQRADLEARVTALTASRNRLRDLMAKAKTVADLLAAEQELTARQAELDGLTSQLAYLKSQVAESTLSIYVSTDRTGITAGLRSWGELMRQGLHGFLSSVQSAITWLFIALPWLAMMTALAAGFVAARNALRRRRHRGEG